MPDVFVHAHGDELGQRGALIVEDAQSPVTGAS
jgi:hypothetical protein